LKYITRQSPKFLVSATFGEPSLTWSDLWKNRPVKLKPKVVLVEVAAAAAALHSENMLKTD